MYAPSSLGWPYLPTNITPRPDAAATDADPVAAAPALLAGVRGGGGDASEQRCGSEGAGVPGLGLDVPFGVVFSDDAFFADGFFAVAVAIAF